MSHHHKLRSWRSVVQVLVGVLAAVSCIAGLGLIWLKPIAPSVDNAIVTPPPISAPSTTAPPSTPVSSSPTLSKVPPPKATSPARTCRVGVPIQIIWPAPYIQIDAPIVKIGTDSLGNLGAPSEADKAKAGWFAPGPRPGSGKGNVLIDGHTYRDNSAIFKEDFSTRVAKGMVVSLIMDNKSVCSYRVVKVWPSILKQGTGPRDYSSMVTSEKFYDSSGPEQLFIVTCSGKWDLIARSHDDVTALIAVPIN